MIQSAEQLMLIQPEDGAIKYSFKSEGNLIPSPTVAGSTFLMPANGLTAVSFKPGEEQGEELWRSAKVGAESSSPVAASDNTFLVIRNPGILTAANVDDGKVAWKTRLKGSGFWATPLVSRDHAYVVNTAGLVQVVNLSDRKITARNELGMEVLGSPAASRGSLYFRGTSSLIKVSISG